jgi:hypothetical protein
MATAPRGIVYLDSWLLGKKQINDPTFAAQLEATMPNLPNGNLGGQFVGGGQVVALGQNDTTAVLPAWRKTYLHLILYANGKPDAGPLRKFAPDMGAYVNEARAGVVPNWRTSFWGANYPRLAEVKKKYDPTSHFWVTPGINADAWVVSPDGRLCPNTKPQDETALFAPQSDNQNDGDPHLIDEIAGPAFPFVYKEDGTVGLNLGVLARKGQRRAV